MNEDHTQKEKMEVDSNSNISWSSEEEDERFNNMEIEPIPFEVFHEEEEEERILDVDFPINNRQLTTEQLEELEWQYKWEQTGIAKVLKEFEMGLERDMEELRSIQTQNNLLTKPN